MSNYEEKILVNLIKTASKSRLIWQKNYELEYVTNGHWAVMTGEIKEIKVKVALYAAFGREIKHDETLILSSGEVNSSDTDLTKGFNCGEATEAGVILPIILGPNEEISYEVRLVNFGTDLAALPADQVELVDTRTAYRVPSNQRGLIFLGDEMEAAIMPVLGLNWYELIQKYTRYAAG